MPDVKMQIESVAGPGGGRSARRLLLRGKARTTVKKVKKALENIINQDVREQAKAEAKGYGPFLFKDSTNSRFDRAVALLKTRAEEMLSARG